MVDDFAQAARALRAAGDGGFRRDVEAELKKAQEKTSGRMKAAIPDGLPRSGGLAALVAADASFDVASVSAGDRVVIRTSVRSRYNIAGMNDTGTFSHPVYGDTSNVVEQSAGVRRGFLDEPFRKGEAELKKAAESAVKTTGSTIDRSI